MVGLQYFLLRFIFAGLLKYHPDFSSHETCSDMLHTIYYTFPSLNQLHKTRLKIAILKSDFKYLQYMYLIDSHTTCNFKLRFPLTLPITILYIYVYLHFLQMQSVKWYYKYILTHTQSHSVKFQTSFCANLLT